tara:strand:- start:9863 stop:10909 length:1047 start_codon:yes stop_codon:yes gene_type:complete
MRVLVTGGAGFIGSHTCVVLLEKGYEIIVLESFANSHEKTIKSLLEIVKLKKTINGKHIEILRADIRDEEILDKLFSDSHKLARPIQAVFHFAGLKSVRESFNNPILYWDVNVNGAIKLLRVMDKYNCRTIIFSSSATIYGLSDKPLLETSEIKPINPYGKTKAAVEQLLNDIYCRNSDSWRIANLRYFNPLGAHPSGMIGESPMGIPNNIFPYITQVAVGKLEKLTIFGRDWPTIDGTGVRDYIHIMDLAEGHLAALEYLLEGNSKIVNINLGTGLGTSVLELINTFELVNNINIPYEISSRRKGDVATLIADNNLALSCLKWTPKRSLKKMCSDGWKWELFNNTNK